MDHTALDRYEEAYTKAGGTHFMKDYQSPEYLAITEPYRKEVQRLEAILQPFLKTYKQLYQEQLAAAVRWEYGRGGLVLQRGFYHPCPIFDLTVGGVNRGKLLKRLTGANPPDYTYGFDAQNRLITVTHPYRDVNSVCMEVILYKNNMSLGIRFHESPCTTMLDGMLECIYDGNRLIQMETASIGRNRIDRLEIDEYYYSEQGLQKHSKIYFSPDPNLITHDITGFSHDEDGYLSGYWSIWRTGKTIDNPHVYAITKKRKV